MAGRLILMKNSETQIKGDCEADDYKDWLKLDHLDFNASANVQHDSETATIHQSSVSLSVPFGPWVAELQKRLYDGTTLGKVELIEVEQKVDGNQKKTWKKVREFTLEDGWVESLNHSWSGIHTHVTLSLQYRDISFSWGDKAAHYNRSEKS